LHSFLKPTLFSGAEGGSYVEHADAYKRAQQRVLTLVDDDVAATDVPACPGWTVKDVIAHLAGFFTAYRSGNPQEAFGPQWGDREVAARKDRSLQECVTEWNDLVTDPGDLFESRFGPVAVSDVLAHEQDIRNALGQPGARDDENIVPSVLMGLSFLENKPETQELPALRIVTEEIDQTLGQGEPAATMRTSTFELFRTIHGRRTPKQVRAMDWEGDSEPWIPSLFLFGPAERPVEE
jgi:uncharacterized protein (TIGR03083 family)